MPLLRRFDDSTFVDRVCARVAAVGKQLAERIVHSYKAWVGRGAVEDDVQPVVIAAIACRRPLVIAYLNTTRSSASLDLYVPALAFRMGGE